MKVTAARVNGWKDKYWQEAHRSFSLAGIDRQQKTGRDEYLTAVAQAKTED